MLELSLFPSSSDRVCYFGEGCLRFIAGVKIHAD